MQAFVLKGKCVIYFLCPETKKVTKENSRQINPDSYRELRRNYRAHAQFPEQLATTWWWFIITLSMFSHFTLGRRRRLHGLVL